MPRHAGKDLRKLDKANPVRRAEGSPAQGEGRVGPGKMAETGARFFGELFNPAKAGEDVENVGRSYLDLLSAYNTFLYQRSPEEQMAFLRSLPDKAREALGSAATALRDLPRTAKQAVETATPESTAAAVRRFGVESMMDPTRLAKSVTPVLSEITTYQGSPYKFEPVPENPLGAFDVKRQGTGVGQQNRGPGTYIAENPKVAQRYRVKYGPVTKTGEKRQPGYVYTVDLPDPMVERMIDLDAPIVNQPRIRDTLLKIADDDVLPTESAEYLRLLLTTSDKRFQKTPLTGYGLIAVPREFGGIFKDVTEANTVLQRYGIPGSKWLDDVSRGPDKGTRNFVVFPGEEKKVKILGREGE